MLKTLIKINAILLINLFAFLIIGNILDHIFLEKYKFKLIFLILSFIVTVFLIRYIIKKDLKHGKH